MFRKLYNLIFCIIGACTGYGVFQLCAFLLGKNPATADWTVSTSERVMLCIVFVIIFAIIFYKLAPVFSRKGKKVADNLGNDLQSISANDLIGAALGVIGGLVIAYLITQIYKNIIPPSIELSVNICLYALLGYIGSVVGNKKLSEIFSYSLAAKRQALRPAEENPYGGYNMKDRRKAAIPKILDTSVIVDGRIAEIMKTGFLEGPVVIPEFVLVELRHIADSSDALKRNRGRRGLDILNKIQEEYGIEIYNTDSEKALKDIPEVDVKLLKLAQIMKGKVVTNDFNLNKVSTIKGVPVLNINELANAMKPMVIPGEVMTVTLIKQGKDPNQAIAYLDDGTMIVVEDGRKMIGKTIDINVTSVLQTAAGRMIFGKVR